MTTQSGIPAPGAYSTASLIVASSTRRYNGASGSSASVYPVRLVSSGKLKFKRAAWPSCRRISLSAPLAIVSKHSAVLGERHAQQLTKRNADQSVVRHNENPAARVHCLNLFETLDGSQCHIPRVLTAGQVMGDGIRLKSSESLRKRLPDFRIGQPFAPTKMNLPEPGVDASRDTGHTFRWPHRLSALAARARPRWRLGRPRTPTWQVSALAPGHEG